MQTAILIVLILIQAFKDSASPLIYTSTDYPRQKRNQINRQGVVLTNCSMEKHLNTSDSKQLKINVVDAFTEQRFKGNSAAVIITDTWLSDELMQSIATENNLSETAYLVQDKDGSYAIRWFSPITEIAFCGHATLASASVIFNDNPEQQKLIFSANAVGKMTITQAEDGYIQMDFPNRKPSVTARIPEELIEGLSIKPSKVLLNEQAYFAVYENESDVLTVTQEKAILKKLAPHDVVVTAPGSEYDFVSRYFWPANGGDEDPVTGSIHTGLAPYWSEQLGKKELLALQASKRSGVLLCRVTEDRVFVSGKAVHYLEGLITI
jgi:PhzF family phenazine biosynthesis protein